MSKALKIVATVALIYTGAGLAVGLGALAGASIGALTAISTLANVMAISTVLGGVARALAPKPRTPGNAGVQQEYSGAVEPVRILFGKIRVSGMNVIPPITTGQDNQDLHQVIALAGHKVSAIDAYYANKTAVTPGSVTGTANDGKVTSGAWANVLWLRGYLGTASQTADYILTQDASASWTANHRGRGIAYVAAKFKADDKKYQNGKPDLTLDVRGMECYDPRLDSSPGANPTNPSYIAYTTNLALCAAAYLMDTKVGRKVPAARIRWDLVVAAANICDESLAGGSAPPSGAQSRYTCNVVLSCADDPDENLAVLEAGMLGRIYRSGGQWHMYAGAWSAPAFALTEADVVGEVSVKSAIARKEKWNCVRGSFLDAANGWEQREFPPRISSAYVTTDGRELWRDVQFAACTDVYENQRNAIILLRQSRNRKTVQAEFGLSAFKVRVFETGTVTIPEIGWSAQTVRCIGWRFNPAGTVTLTLREEYSTDWANPATADYTVPGTVVTPTIGYTRPGTPATFTVTSRSGALDFAWSAGDPVLSGQTYRIYENTSGQPFSTATMIWEGSSTQATIVKSDTTTRDYWIAAAYGANESAARPTGAGTAAAALPSSFAAWSLMLSGVAQAGTTLTKISSSDGWNAQAYSVQGFASGAYASAQAGQTTGALMFGLSADPDASADTVIDYAWYFQASSDGGLAQIYEGGAAGATFGSYTTDTILAISWDGGTVRYWKDNVLVRELPARPASLYFDSSFYSPSASLKNVTFRPNGASAGGVTQGAALNRDPDLRDASAWWDWGNTAIIGSTRFVPISDGVSGLIALRSAAAAPLWVNGTDRIAVDAAKTYRISGWARRSSDANGYFYLGVAAFDSAGANIEGAGSQWAYAAASSATLTTSWARFEGFVGAGTSFTFPSNARTMTPLVILNYTGTAGYHEAQGIRLEECAPTSLIAPGATTYAASVFDAGPIDFSNIA